MFCFLWMRQVRENYRYKYSHKCSGRALIADFNCAFMKTPNRPDCKGRCIYSLWKADESFDENYCQKNITGDEELVHPLGSASKKLSDLHKRNSPEIDQGYTRYTTVEASPFAPSRLMQK